MKRLLAAFAISAVLLNGCNQERRAEKKPSASGVILSTTVAPGSAFQMSVSFDPAQPRMSTKTKFRITLLDPAGAPVSGAQVQASLVMPLMDMGKNGFPLPQAGIGEYEGTGQFTMSGEWEAVFIATAAGKTGKTTFNVRVED
ncbi:MAG: FixH family protein [Acidobacteriia bacterium]|nr:FixH family protein [Terriglobia bacterium]